MKIFKNPRFIGGVRFFVLSILMVCTVNGFGQDKSQYDIHLSGIKKDVSINGLSSPDYQTLANNYIELSLSRGGHFTIGTTQGLSDSDLDNQCQITFGHPFAKTSHPVFCIDGTWYTIESYFSMEDSVLLLQEGGTLLLYAAETGLLKFEFFITARSQEPVVDVTIRVTNSDTTSHLIQGGLFFDPALGKWGDGSLYSDSRFLTRDTVLAVSLADDSLRIWEKSSGSRGICTDFVFDFIPPEKIIAVNWADNFQELEPVFTQSGPRTLYDLLLKIYWPDSLLAAGKQLENRVSINLEEPDFTQPGFLRWNVPAFLSMTNHVMFPQVMQTRIEIVNTTGEIWNDAHFLLDLPSGISSPVTDIPLANDAHGRVYQDIPLHADLIYEDKIVTVSVQAKKSGQVLDILERDIFIPATPVSDTGLVILNDSLSSAQFPEIQIIFSAEVEATGQRLLNLTENNIFLFENSTRIPDFTLERYSGGGTNLADVVFVLDVSGSMGNEINAVVANLSEFADSLVYRGYDFRIGVVTFSTTIDNVWDLTNDVEQIKQNLSSIDLWGGIEDSPAALYRGSELSFRPGSKRTIIWITDEEYPETSYTVEEVVNRMLAMDITVHGVGLLSLQTDWFNPIVIPTGGTFYDINGNFRDILIDVTRFESQDQFLLTYSTSLQINDINDIRLEVHYGGLGAIKTYTPEGAGGSVLPVAQLRCFPNPFNPRITLRVDNPHALPGTLEIYNILGQRVRTFPLQPGGGQSIIWDASTAQGAVLSSGFYIVQLKLADHRGVKIRDIQKILYLK